MELDGDGENAMNISFSEETKTFLISQSTVLDTKYAVTFAFINIHEPSQSFSYEINSEDLDSISMKDFFTNIFIDRRACFKAFDSFGNSIRLNETVNYYRGIQPFYIEKVVHFSPRIPTFPIQIKTPTGKIIEFIIQASMTVMELKQDLEKSLEISAKNQVLFFKECELDNDENFLCEYNLKYGSIINLTLKIKSSCFNNSALCHVNRIDESQVVLEEYNLLETPKWRTLTSYGLCIEGFCTNISCPAFRNLVLISKGMGYYDLASDQYNNFCPCCSKYVKPEIFAFVNCSFCYFGVQCELDRQVQKIIDVETMIPDNEYTVLDLHEIYKFDWQSLKIFTRPYDIVFGQPSSRYTALFKKKAGEICQICCQDIQRFENINLPSCSHSFHHRCYVQLAHLNIKCPMCHL